MDLPESAKLENQEMSKRKELEAAETSLEIVELQDLEYSKQIAEIQLKRKQIASGLIQGKHNTKRIRLELRTIETLKWQALKQEQGKY